MKTNFFNKNKFGLILSTFLFFSANHAFADTAVVDGVTISKIRAVGTYTDPTFNATVEVWFTVPVTWPAGLACQNFRVEIDATQRHLVAAAYLALSTGKKVDIFIDTTLPIRGTMCQISYLDVQA